MIRKDTLIFWLFLLNLVFVAQSIRCGGGEVNKEFARNGLKLKRSVEPQNTTNLTMSSADMTAKLSAAFQAIDNLNLEISSPPKHDLPSATSQFIYEAILSTNDDGYERYHNKFYPRIRTRRSSSSQFLSNIPSRIKNHKNLYKSINQPTK